MQSILKVARFQLRDARNSMLIFYVICAGVACLFQGVAWSADGEGQFGGFGIAGLIFIFVLGLNCFSTVFKFTQANNVSRLRFFLGTSVALFIIAALMAVLGLLFGVLLEQLLPYQSLFAQVYHTQSLLARLCWTFAIYALIAHGGWLICMAYYRANIFVKVLISITPSLVLMLVTYAGRLTGGAYLEGAIEWVGWALGLAEVPNPFAAVLTLLIGTLVAASGVWLLTRRASVRY